MDTKDIEAERKAYAKGLAQGALARPEADREAAVTEVIEQHLLRLEARERVVVSLLGENSQLRDRIVGNERVLPPGTSIADQLGGVREAAKKVLELALGGRLDSVALIWNEGKAVVLHASQKPAALIEIATKLPQ